MTTVQIRDPAEKALSMSERQPVVLHQPDNSHAGGDFGPRGLFVGPRGLLVRDPYATKLLNGDKIWEIRGKATQIRGPVVIIKSGTGRAYGTVRLIRVLGPLALDDLLIARELPQEEREEYRRADLPYSKTYAYVFSDPQWFDRPIAYNHPSGAVTWVRLPELNLETVRYAPGRHRAAQLQLV